ncbi:DUF3307 domain-containing protein [Lacrimispora saccharolytica]|uniref:DUF3307 domain-containing protein n=1 Tax=Lacrimispora saccharolytica (strain ATCC 35040 / DSM 2544 / NRCC 2533 / WM1) TaxID=610130 RepID=D9R686_LACSW|nr:DUF3307 domain-containing protein [Lacrimispora saccharolytica]ADL03520.1 conserved hypothetical protein [[Clostridium] saccharolyticum WM1]QRV18330.1 DUF3307 domain-containing protein [Lacrimispora saccharolytica]
MILKLLIIGHIIGDFYVQTGKTANKKKNSIPALVLHSLSYSFVLFICAVIPLTRDQVPGLLVFSFVAGLFHGGIDFYKIRIEKNKSLDPGQKIWLFFFDQMLHTAILIIGWGIAGFTGGAYIHMLEKRYDAKILADIINMAMGILICGQPASLLIKLVFEAVTKERDTENPKIGTYIGILEREIIFLLGMIGQYSTIGFVLTAKSVARFKRLEDQAFSEKYLIGTLLSAFIAIACAVANSYFKI